MEGGGRVEKLAGQGLRQFECGDGTTANTPPQLPPPIIPNLPRVLHFLLHFWHFSGTSFKEKCSATPLQTPKTSQVSHFTKKARVDFPVWPIRSRESLCECCVVLTPARFMVISRIDNIKYGPAAAAGEGNCQIKQQFINPHLGFGHGKEAQFWKGKGGHWSVLGNSTTTMYY